MTTTSETLTVEAVSNTIIISRGDSYERPLFINQGSDLDPIRYSLQGGIVIEETSNIAPTSILKAGTILEAGSKLNNSILELRTTLKSDAYITELTYLLASSYIIKDSKLSSSSTLNGTLFTVDTLILGDEVYVGVMEANKIFEEAIIKKKYTSSDNVNDSGDLIIRFESNDTLQLIGGKYFYSIKVKTINKDNTADVSTIIKNAQFFIEG